MVGKSCKLLFNLEYWNEKVHFYCREFIDKFVEIKHYGYLKFTKKKEIALYVPSVKSNIEMALFREI